MINQVNGLFSCGKMDKHVEYMNISVGNTKERNRESGMLNKFHKKQQEMELALLEQLVPQNHLLRKID